MHVSFHPHIHCKYVLVLNGNGTGVPKHCIPGGSILALVHSWNAMFHNVVSLSFSTRTDLQWISGYKLPCIVKSDYAMIFGWYEMYSTCRYMEAGPENSHRPTIFKFEPKVCWIHLRTRQCKKDKESRDDLCEDECNPLQHIYWWYSC